MRHWLHSFRFAMAFRKAELLKGNVYNIISCNLTEVTSKTIVQSTVWYYSTLSNYEHFAKNQNLNSLCKIKIYNVQPPPI